MQTIDINCDMGESFGAYTLGADALLMPLVTSANIACGFHAGDPLVMARTVRLAKAAGTAVGAHPGYQDLQGFGRRVLDLSSEEVEAMLAYQIGALAAVAHAAGVELVHVKPHGALYNQAAQNRELAGTVAKAVASFSRSLILVGLAGSYLVDAGLDIGLQVASEGFPERGYTPEGTLMSRKLPGALIHDPQEAARQAVRLALDGIFYGSGAERRQVKVDTLCIHGDSPHAPEIAAAVRAALEQQNIQMRRLGL